MASFGFDQAGIDRIDADLPGTQLFGKHSGDSIDRAFGPAVDGALSKKNAGDELTDVDDAAAFTQVRHGRGADQ